VSSHHNRKFPANVIRNSATRLAFQPTAFYNSRAYDDTLFKFYGIWKVAIPILVHNSLLHELSGKTAKKRDVTRQSLYVAECQVRQVTRAHPAIALQHWRDLLNWNSCCLSRVADHWTRLQDRRKLILSRCEHTQLHRKSIAIKAVCICDNNSTQLHTKLEWRGVCLMQRAWRPDNSHTRSSGISCIGDQIDQILVKKNRWLNWPLDNFGLTPTLPCYS
jgi:hypothetical protein